MECLRIGGDEFEASVSLVSSLFPLFRAHKVLNATAGLSQFRYAQYRFLCSLFMVPIPTDFMFLFHLEICRMRATLLIVS